MNHQPTPVHPKYRPDIDGLRAIAVSLVVIFHAFPSQLAGGFIGVDIFFVISGFLISTILFNGFKKNVFSFSEFYTRRVLRIFPALLLVLFCTYLFGWFNLLNDEFKQLGKHIAGGSGFISNFFFWSESGYFDNVSETKPLLHLWSLAIEEQFYIFWPLILWFSWKKRFNFFWLTIGIITISFTLNIWGAKVDPSGTFYSPQTRFWEMLIGSALAYLTLQKQGSFPQFSIINLIQTKINNFFSESCLNNIQSFLGLTLITLGVLFISKDRSFPGWWALVPTLGTVFIISAGPQAWINRVILSNRALVWLGLLSYPLYLWHWPVLTLSGIVEVIPLSDEKKFIAVGVSVLLAWMTYKLIELPLRSVGNRKMILGTELIIMIIFGCVGYYTYSQNGLKFRVVDRLDYLDYFENSIPEWKYFNQIGLSEKYQDKCNFYDIPKYLSGKSTKIPAPYIDQSCYQKNDAYKNRVLIWGDSHAQQLYFGLKNHLTSDWQILQIASSGCSPELSSESSSTSYCSHSNWFALKTIKETQPDVVIIAQNVGHDLKKFERLLGEIKKFKTKKIIFTGPSPHWVVNLPKIIIRKFWNKTPERTLFGIDRKIYKENQKLAKSFQPAQDVFYADIMSVFCNSEGCLTYLNGNRRDGITSWDTGHLTPVASDFLAKKMLANLVMNMK